MKNKGITLVALVVTIIILLILAGISIVTLTGSGLFEKARLAEQESKNAEEKQEAILGEYENTINKYISTSRDDVETKKQKTMSYEEHFTGEYYLDGKPIYAKTINVGNYPNGTYKYVPHNVSNYKEMWIDVSNSFVLGNDVTLSSLFINADKNGLSTYIKGDTIALAAVDNRTSYIGIITVKYTKITD